MSVPCNVPASYARYHASLQDHKRCCITVTHVFVCFITCQDMHLSLLCFFACCIFFFLALFLFLFLTAMLLQTQCSFAGAWGGGHAPKAFYVSSYFWDRAVEAGQNCLPHQSCLCFVYSIRLVYPISLVYSISLAYPKQSCLINQSCLLIH